MKKQRNCLDSLLPELPLSRQQDARTERNLFEAPEEKSARILNTKMEIYTSMRQQ